MISGVSIRPLDEALTYLEDEAATIAIERAEVIDVQMGDEHLVEFVEREPAGDVVGDRALTEVEDEVPSVSELHEDRGVHLSRADGR